MVTKSVCFQAVGRRKDAVARVRLMPGKGEMVVNGRPLPDYFKRETLKMIIEQPLQITNTLGKFDIIARVDGGGLSGQAGAVRLGISRALAKADESLRPTLRSQGFLTRDPRMVERKKYGQPGARKRFQFSKR
ncbi:MAG: 30S ribosomal protein S9 [candidate division KSB1 bacterium]|nr:30S ribosomal protein S9 [candidate division KSB1 bacterium]MDZ7295674.1 30S ribosomal protein S9 [candidate division KSB1 bacterium]MDZ7336979.1 30S ribosomal protein S9 [candidate division KSB1 bacterium]MDZ7378561.1 30S ribosomal protein S9 [candidate division KSB1 bacterium]MDZ7386658.1 30S ribosomal protein S9 [candidate division KSB1 bacterium]